MSDELVVVDLSHWQESVDFDALFEAGIVGVILKATQGTSVLDDTFHDRYAAARAAGLSVASYHFLEHGDVTGQMRWYLDQAMPDYGERLVIDYEEESCRIEDLVEAVDFLLRDPRNLQLTAYGASMLTDHADAADEDQQSVLRYTSLWAARYSSEQPRICTVVWPRWTLWQFTDKANVDGVEGPCDGNRFNGTEDACRLWFGPVNPPVPGPEPDDLTSYVDLRYPAGTPYEISINGSLVVKGVA